MAVEKMKIISVIGKISDLDRVSRMIVLDGNVHMLNALSEINANYFELEASEDHIQAMQELSDLKPYNERRDFSKEEDILKSFHRIFDMKLLVDRQYLSDSYDYKLLVDDISEKYKTVQDISEKINKRISVIERIQGHIENLKHLKNTGIELEGLMNLQHVSFKLMSLSRDSFQKLKLNYENIPSVVFQISTDEDNVVVVSFTPMQLKDETDRIFESLNYKRLDLPYGYKGIAEEIIRTLNKEITAEKEEIEKLKKSASDFKSSFHDDVRRAYTLVQLEKKLEHVKSEVAIGKNLFYMFGFVPEGNIEQLCENIKSKLEKDIIVITETVANRRSGHAPPTKLKNNIIFKPFESLISMYGIPCYHELDPTAFFGLSYMLLFGAMFGDLGQGLIILLGGLLLKYKLKNENFGGILSRLGMSSMFFGLLYGSIFGNEHIISGLWLKPMENINTMLISAIVFGVVLINIGYIYGLINFYRRQDIEEGIFGREGVAGFLFFWVLLYTVWSQVSGTGVVPLFIPIFALVILLLLMVFKQPLANILKGHKVLYEESPTDYYIEAGFGIIETLLSILSNVISFIRVGAFALNHVGLYIAFATMAEMVNSSVGGVLVLILGNIVIIGLEGLIVFIQSLRLEYYELFSKYYSGYGIQYKPACLLSPDCNIE